MIVFAQYVGASFLSLFLYDMIIMRRPIRWWFDLWLSLCFAVFIVLSWGFIYG